MLAKAPDLQLAIGGVILPEQALELNVIRKHHDSVDDCIDEIEQAIFALVEPHRQ